MKSVTLIASRTVDHINNLDQSVRLERAGGPALYCTQAMEALGCRVHLVTAKQPVNVFITIRNRRESIRIDRIAKIKLAGRLPARDVLLSPILGEFELEQLARRRCQIFLDTQGYIRAKGEDRSRRWLCDIRLVKNVVALKVNQHESRYVPEEILDLFRTRILLITRGREGVEIWDHNKRRVIRVNPIDAPDTLGAGDTFFGSFVAAYLELGSARPAAQTAITRAAQLLRRK